MKEQFLYIDYMGPTFNKYAMMYPHQKGKEREECENAVLESILLYSVTPVTSPVRIIFQPVLGSRKRGTGVKNQRAYDIINYANTIKMIEDRLVKEGVIKNDSKAFVYSHMIEKPIKDLTKNFNGFLVIIQEEQNWDLKYTEKMFKKYNFKL